MTDPPVAGAVLVPLAVAVADTMVPALDAALAAPTPATDPAALAV
jgi:hypothetical protein